MGRKNAIERLEPEIRDVIGRLVDRGRTLDEIIEALRPLEADVSRSGLHRYLKSQAKLGERLRHSRAVAEVLVRRDGEETQSRLAAANIELVHSFIFGLLEKAEEAEEQAAAEAEAHADGWRATMDGKEKPISILASPKEMHAVAKSLDHLASAAKKNQDFIAEAEKRAEAKAKKQAVAAAEEVGRQRGLSAEVLDAIRAGILGVKPG